MRDMRVRLCSCKATSALCNYLLLCDGPAFGLSSSPRAHLDLLLKSCPPLVERILCMCVARGCCFVDVIGKSSVCARRRALKGGCLCALKVVVCARLFTVVVCSQVMRGV